MTTQDRAAARDWLDDYTARLDDVAARAERTGIEMAAVTGTARSRDGSVTVTVEPSGALLDVVFSPVASSITRERLAEQLLGTAAEARRQAAAAAVQAAERLWGADSATMTLLRASLTGPAQ
ncbi:hypothetical protein PSU4_22830 [Pseudonocardia sulfidoxydans NBRC 16205]|uniref:YbaB/EbfC DNA-binding family protein n=1 Tax=Pseudonocardia sulfidoxydans NBRC 16205 TaxID=1223511 RepID=A0A511DEV8_9PSEU|nr:YbaB/EbfC family nucleoid-associated protein [Pseudonocardia sulfidoxydans]GEL23329.1 hypothetical protein PSU4_22830 [Pseudonocardia sulfidoxydans NBRC 16205]